MQKPLANAEKANAGPMDRRTDGPTDKPTDRRTDEVTYKVACTRLKIAFSDQS